MTTATVRQPRGGRVPTYSHDIEDIAALRDTLGRGAIAMSVAENLRHRPEAQVIGVYGSWGSGKSFLLSQVIATINARNATTDEHIICCTFSPWKHELEADLAIGLVKTLRDLHQQQMAQFPPGANVEQLLTRARGTALRLLGVLAKVALNSSNTAVATMGVAAQAFSEEMAQGNDVDQIEILMAQLIDQICDVARQGLRKPVRLAMFIDDLDRCSPENMVKLFEWCKVHLRVPGVTYIIALDHVAGARAITGMYKKYLGNEEDLAYGYRYLEKLIDIEYELEQTQLAEAMALAEVFGSDNFRQVSNVARDDFGGEFPGMTSIDMLFQLRALRIPRTMLKIVYKYKTSLDVIRGNPNLVTQLPSTFHFWLLFLIALYYRLDPDSLARFVDGRGELYNVFSAASQAEAISALERDLPDAWKHGPPYEFIELAREVHLKYGATLKVPTSEALRLLGKIIRENALAQKPS